VAVYVLPGPLVRAAARNTFILVFYREIPFFTPIVQAFCSFVLFLLTSN